MQLKEQACVCVHPVCEIHNKCLVSSEFWKSFLIIIIIICPYIYMKCADLCCCIMFAAPGGTQMSTGCKTQNCTNSLICHI
jgi:hypothetical protein